jgi:hypothetical protein
MPMTKSGTAHKLADGNHTFRDVQACGTALDAADKHFFG